MVFRARTLAISAQSGMVRRGGNGFGIKAPCATTAHGCGLSPSVRLRSVVAKTGVRQIGETNLEIPATAATGGCRSNVSERRGAGQGGCDFFRCFSRRSVSIKMISSRDPQKDLL